MDRHVIAVNQSFDVQLARWFTSTVKALLTHCLDAEQSCMPSSQHDLVAVRSMPDGGHATSDYKG
eukprot:2536370-Amphidinium_carterae.1